MNVNNNITVSILAEIPEWLFNLIVSCRDETGLSNDEIFFEALCGYLGDLKNGTN